jgi:endonuclease-8
VPEGDTIWRAARTMHGVLAGRTVTALASPLVAVASGARRLRVVGSRIDAVEARGKHLLMRFSSGAVLHTHQGMHGTWHLYRAGSRWRKPSHLARATVTAGEAVAVCFASPTVELLSTAEAARHPALSRLGPDVVAGAFDAEAARFRLRARADVEIGAALLDQAALAGIGNVFKSEVLFLCGVDPATPVAVLDDAALDRVIETARVQMRRNLHGLPRRTTSALAEGRHWVYRRGGQPCRRCGTPVRRRLQGDAARSTYWCPSCQGAPGPLRNTRRKG